MTHCGSQNLPSAKDAAVDGVVAHGVPSPGARDQLSLRDNPRRMLTEDQDRIEDEPRRTQGAAPEAKLVRVLVDLELSEAEEHPAGTG